jgi:tetratricopeptide (TPR) repeat protein
LRLDPFGHFKGKRTPRRKSFIAKVGHTIFAIVDKTQKIGIVIAMVPLALLGIFYAIGSWRPVTTIKPIGTPDWLVKQGFTPEATQTIFREDMLAILQSASSVMPTQVRDTLEGGTQNFRLDIGDSHMSVQDAIDTAKTVFHQNSEVSAEIVAIGTGLSMSGRVIRPGGSSQPFEVFQNNDNVVELLSKGAHKAMKALNPYVEASGMLQDALQECKLHRQCNDGDAASSYQTVLDPDVTPPKDRTTYAKWAYLGLSKIAELNLDYLSEIEYSRRALRQDANFAWARYNWGIALRGMGCNDEALEMFRHAVASHDRVAANHNALGGQYMTLARRVSDPDPAVQARIDGAASKAEAEFVRATELDPLYKEALVNLAVTLEWENRHDESLEILKTAAVLKGDVGASAHEVADITEYPEERWHAVTRRVDEEMASSYEHPRCSGIPETSTSVGDNCPAIADDRRVPPWPDRPFDPLECVRFSRDDAP